MKKLFSIISALMLSASVRAEEKQEIPTYWETFGTNEELKNMPGRENLETVQDAVLSSGTLMGDALSLILPLALWGVTFAAAWSIVQFVVQVASTGKSEGHNVGLASISKVILALTLVLPMGHLNVAATGVLKSWEWGTDLAHKAFVENIGVLEKKQIDVKFINADSLKIGADLVNALVCADSVQVGSSPQSFLSKLFNNSKQAKVTELARYLYVDKNGNSTTEYINGYAFNQPFPQITEDGRNLHKIVFGKSGDECGEITFKLPNQSFLAKYTGINNFNDVEVNEDDQLYFSTLKGLQNDLIKGLNQLAYHSGYFSENVRESAEIYGTDESKIFAYSPRIPIILSAFKDDYDEVHKDNNEKTQALLIHGEGMIYSTINLLTQMNQTAAEMYADSQTKTDIYDKAINEGVISGLPIYLSKLFTVNTSVVHARRDALSSMELNTPPTAECYIDDFEGCNRIMQGQNNMQLLFKKSFDLIRQQVDSGELKMHPDMMVSLMLTETELTTMEGGNTIGKSSISTLLHNVTNIVLAESRQTYINKPYDFTINPFVQAQILGENMRVGAISMYASIVVIDGASRIVSNIPWVGGFFAAGWQILDGMMISALVALYSGGVLLSIGLPILLFVTLFVMTAHWIYQLFVTLIVISIYLPIMLAKSSNQLSMDQKEEKGAMALLSMTLRPILGVTAAFISMGLLFIVYGLFNYAWWRFTAVMFPNPGLAETVVMLSSYTWLSFMIIANGIAYINELQENVDDITHGGTFRAMPMNDNISKIEGMSQSSAQAFSKPSGGAFGKTSGAASSKQDKELSKRKKGGDGIS
jgi:conjugal transfer/type IV secretion protein DotA/TraY